MEIREYKWLKRTASITLIVLFSICMAMFAIDVYLHWKFKYSMNRTLTISGDYFQNWRNFNWFLHDALFLAMVIFGATYLIALIRTRKIVIRRELFFFIITLLTYLVGVNYMSLPYFL